MVLTLVTMAHSAIFFIFHISVKVQENIFRGALYSAIIF